ncbi:MAG: 2,3-cyclic 3-phosphodiesterase [Solirubrobacteraceae bacterium]|nr:2,3-cyclic 3-phosphodiesterase [Solirubrobacteraceae bacterium]
MSGGARLFVAVELPAGAREQIAGWARRAVPVEGGVRRLDPAALHVTLCFLGTQPVAAVGEIAAVVEAQARPVGPLALGAPVWLPRRRPRALAIELHDERGALGDLAADLVRELGSAIGWEPESRRWHPHVTVARMRPGATTPGPLDPTPAIVFEPTALTVFRSRLEPDGADYEALARVTLLWTGDGWQGAGHAG